MQIIDNQKVIVSTLSRSPTNVGSSVPIKKRPIILSRLPSPPPPISASEEGVCNDSEKKYYVIEKGSLISDNRLEKLSATNFSSGNPHELKGDLTISSENPTMRNCLELNFTYGNLGKDHSKSSELVDNKPRSSQLLSVLKEPSVLMLMGEGQHVSNDKCVPCNGCSMKFQLAAKNPSEVPKIGQDRERNFIQHLKVEPKLHGLPCSNDQHKRKDTGSDTGLDITFSNLDVNRLNWDLNAPTEAWESTVSCSGVDLKTVEQVASGQEDLLSKANIDLYFGQMHARECNELNHYSRIDLPINGEPKLKSIANENYDFRAFLDLQLKPYDIGSNSGKKLPTILGLSPAPSFSEEPVTSNQAAHGAVEHEPCNNGNLHDNFKVFPKIVRPEPLEETVCQAPNTSSGGLKLSFDRNVKLEPQEGIFRASQNHVERKSSIAKLDNKVLDASRADGRNVATSVTKKSQDVSQCVKKALDLMSEYVKVNVVEDGSKISSEALPSTTKSPSVNIKMLSDTGIPIAKAESPGECFNEISRCQRLENEYLISVSDAQEMTVLPAHCPESLLSNGKEHSKAYALGMADIPVRCPEFSILNEKVHPNAHSEAHFSALPSSSDRKDSNVSEVLPEYELLFDGTAAVGSSNDMDMSEDDKPGGSPTRSCLTDVHNGDGEAGNLLSFLDPGGSSDGMQDSGSGNCSHSIDASISMLPNSCDDVDKEVCKAARLGEFSDPGEKGDNVGEMENICSTDKVHESHIKNDKGLDSKPRFDQTPTGKEVQETDANSKLQDSQGYDPQGAKIITNLKRSLDNDAIAIDEFRYRGKRNLTTNNDPVFGKSKSYSERFLTSTLAKERLVDKSTGRDPTYSKGNSDRFRRLKSDKYQYASAEKDGAHLGYHWRRDEEITDSSHDHTFNHSYGLGQGSSGFRLSRRKDVAEPQIAFEADGNSRIARIPMNDKLQYISGVSFRSQSPGGRDKRPADIPIGCHPVRDVSPTRGLGRNACDFVRFDHEKFQRAAAAEMLGPFPFSHPLAPCEQEEGFLMRRRRRRSLSPGQRRGSLLHSPRMCQDSSPRSQMRLPRQWSPPEGSQIAFDVHSNVLRSRSPPFVRAERMSSPSCAPYLCEEVLVRRHGSPYLDRLPDAMHVAHSREHLKEIGSSREYMMEIGPSRPIRGPERGIQRFDLVGPEEMDEDERQCFGPEFHGEVGEFPELFINIRRNFAGRDGTVRSVRERLGPLNDRENFVSHGDSGSSRPMRFCPGGVVEFRERTRNFGRRFSNQLGNMSCRTRDIVNQEDNLMRRREQGWVDTASADIRMKRRRF